MSLSHKRTQKLTRTELEKALKIARGEEGADLLIINVKIQPLGFGSCCS